MAWEGHVVEIEGCGMNPPPKQKESGRESAEGMDAMSKWGLAPVSEGFIGM